MEAFMDYIVWILGFLLAASELLAYIPFVRANSVVQLFIQIMQALKHLIKPQVPPAE